MRAIVPVLLAAALVASPAAALPVTVPIAPAPGTWSIDIGAAALHAPYYIGSHRTGTDVFPQAGFTYGSRLKGSLNDGARWSALKTKRVQIGPVLEYRQSDRFQKALPARGTRNAIEAGGFIQIDTPVAELEGRIRKAVTGYGGWSGDLSADTGINLGRLSLGAEARLAWADRSFVYNLYGPDTLGRRVGREIEAPSYLTAGMEGDIGYHLTPRLTAGVLVSYDRFLQTFESNARKRRGATQLGTALTYHFGNAGMP